MASEVGHVSDPSLLIMISLAAGPKHGYGMIEDIQNFAGARLGPGTLYGAIARMEQRGWIEALPVDDRRRPYRLTVAGIDVMRAQLANLEALTIQARARLSGAST